MNNLTPDGQKLVSELAVRYNLSADAVLHMLIAVNNGSGSMAQFNCPELGGGGQWMSGGMTMVGDMFNHGLKTTVDNLCSELSNSLASMQLFEPIPRGSQFSSEWWPMDLGQPFSSGAQNNIRYAIFPNRLAVELNGQVTVYDTLDNNIGGVSQQQGGDTSLTFSSQYGTLSVNSLPIIYGAGSAPSPQENFAEPAQGVSAPDTDVLDVNNSNGKNSIPVSPTTNLPGESSSDEVFVLIEKLAKLHEVGAISDDEYNSKKTELLSRI